MIEERGERGKEEGKKVAKIFSKLASYFGGAQSETDFFRVRSGESLSL